MECGQLLPDGFFFGAGGRWDRDAHNGIEVATLGFTNRQAHAGKTELFAGLSACRDLQLRFSSERGDGDIAAQNRIPSRDLQFQVDVGSVDFKIRMTLVFDAKVEIA